jgi:hypothetical protein
MKMTDYIIRSEGVVWRDVSGEVVIAERDNSTLHVLNKTASLIWTLADGTNQMNDLATAICNRFDVTPEQARVDTEEFCKQLLRAGLVWLKDGSQECQEVKIGEGY